MKKADLDKGKKGTSGARSSALVPKDSNKTVKTGNSAKNTDKKVKSGKKSRVGIIIGVAAGVILVAGAVAAFFLNKKPIAIAPAPQIEVVLADGTVQNIKAEEAYAELTTDKFFQGTVIDGIDVGGMTKDEAFNAVTGSHPEKPLEINIKLDLEGKKLQPDFKNVSYEYNTREVIDTAFAEFRPSNDTDLTKLAECYNGKEQLKNKHQEYETEFTVKIDGAEEVVKKVLTPYVKDYSTVKNASIVSFDTETHEFVVDKEKTGYEIDVDTAAKEVKALLDSGTYSGTVKVKTVKKEPEITEAMIRENFGLIGSEWTTTTGEDNRNTNIRQACDNINGTILEPGEVFSFNEVVGQRTYDAGFVAATVIAGGQYEQGLGGGICQVSTTLYNAALKSDLKIVERHTHAWPSEYISTGLDATVDWPSLDLKFENDTDYQIIVVSWWDPSDRSCNAEIYGKKLPDGKTIDTYAEIVSSTPAGPDEYIEDRDLPVGETKVLRQAHQGITAYAYKIWYDADGNEISRDFYNSSYYGSYGKRVAVGVLKPDGTYASIDSSTGEVIDPDGTPTPTPTPTASVTPNPDKPTGFPDKPTPVPDTPTPTPTDTPPPDTPTPEVDTPTPEVTDTPPENEGPPAT